MNITSIYHVAGSGQTTPLAANTLGEALRRADAELPEVGVYAWMADTRERGAPRVYVFDLVARVALATLLDQAFEPNFAAALVWHEFVQATLDVGGEPEPPGGLDGCDCFLINRVTLSDGSQWSVFADVDARLTVPEHFGKAGALPLSAFSVLRRSLSH